MKRSTKLLIVADAMALLIAARAGATSVVSGPHNLNNSAGVTLPQGQICIACHTPHNVPNNVGGSYQFLWNHTTNLSKTYVLYGNASGVTLDTQSRLCLSCHDGGVAVDSFGSNAGSINISTLTQTDINGNPVVGGALIASLANQHPVGVAYGSATYASTSGGTITYGNSTHMNSLATNQPFVGVIAGGSSHAVSLAQPGDIASGDLNAVVGCGSCHTPHDDQNGFFLRIKNTNSQLCLQCHIE